MTRRLLAALALLALSGCAAPGPVGEPSVAGFAGEWRGRWLGVAGHAVAALTVKPDGASRMTMYLDGGDRVSTGTLIALPSGRVRYTGVEGTGWAAVDGGRLRFVPDGGGGSGLFDRVP